MTASIPNSFNMDDLNEMLENAIPDVTSRTVEEEDIEITQELVTETAIKVLELATEECPDPLVHKVMMMMICQKMVEWHMSTSERMLEHDNVKSAFAWSRDAGKFQAMMDILMSISVGPNDFMFHDN